MKLKQRGRELGNMGKNSLRPRDTKFCKASHWEEACVKVTQWLDFDFLVCGMKGGDDDDDVEKELPLVFVVKLHELFK